MGSRSCMMPRNTFCNMRKQIEEREALFDKKVVFPVSENDFFSYAVIVKATPQSTADS